MRLSEGNGILGLLVRLRTMRRQATDRSRMPRGLGERYSGRR